MDRLSIINFFVNKLGVTDYLELGTFTGYTLDGCIAQNKVGIDPQCGHYKGPNQVFCETSDEFFKKLTPDTKFQLCFIDGLHEASQVARDIDNCLEHLSIGGVVILHDLNPPTELHTTYGDEKGNWNGDCYKAFVEFRRNITGYETYTISTDWGVGVIKDNPLEIKGRIIREGYPRTWDYFNNNRKSLLNLVSVEDFLKSENKPNNE